jgi:hypothetical protein
MSVSWRTSSPVMIGSPSSCFVQQAALIRDLALLGRELVDQRLELLVREGTKVGEGVHAPPPSGMGGEYTAGSSGG